MNCLNFKKFVELCISLLEMISILVIGCHPNFEPIEFKLGHFYFIKEIKNVFLVHR